MFSIDDNYKNSLHSMFDNYIPNILNEVELLCKTKQNDFVLQQLLYFFFLFVYLSFQL